MEKELFLTTLKGKAQVDNLSDRTYDEVATLWLPQFADDEKITEDSWKLPVQMLKTMSGQVRHEVSTGIAGGKTKWEEEAASAKQKAIDEAIAAAKAEWEKAHPTAKKEGGEDPKDEPVDVAAEVKKQLEALTGEGGAIGKLSKQFSDYLAQQAAKEKAATEASTREQVREYLLSRGVDENDFALDYTIEKLEVGENPDVAALKLKAEKDYEANFKKIHKNEGANPFGGGAGGGGNDTGAAAWLKGRVENTKKEAESAEARRKLLK